MILIRGGVIQKMKLILIQDLDERPIHSIEGSSFGWMKLRLPMLNLKNLLMLQDITTFEKVLIRQEDLPPNTPKPDESFASLVFR